MMRLLSALFLAGYVHLAAAAAPEKVFVDPAIVIANPEHPLWQTASPECRWDTYFFAELQNRAKDRVLAGVKTAGAGTLTLNAALVATREGEPDSGWIEMTGRLSDAAGRQTGDFLFRYELYDQVFSRCKYAKDVGKWFAYYVADWLNAPAPSVRITETVESLYPDKVPASDWQNCTSHYVHLPYYLTEGAPGKIIAVSNFDAFKGRKLDIKVANARLLGGGVFTGSRWLKLVGRLTEGDREIGSFIALRHSMRSWTTCGIVDRLNYELAGDIMAWLENPTADARLGDADAATDTSP